MKKTFLIIALMISAFPARALELTKTTEHNSGYDFLYNTKINGQSYPIEIPLLKCSNELPKGCYGNKREATNAAWKQAKKFEKMMRESLKGTAP